MEENFQQQSIQPKQAPLAGVSPVIFVILAMFVIFMAYFIIGGIISYVAVGDELNEIKDVRVTRLLIAFTQFMFLLFPTIFLSLLQGNNTKTFFRLNKPKTDVFIFSILGIIFIQPFLPFYVWVQDTVLSSIPVISSAYAFLEKVYESLYTYVAKIASAYSVPEMLVAILVIAVTPAICEEFLFRGLILKNLERAYSPAKAIIVSGILFGIFHLQPLTAVPLVLLGIYLGLVVIYSNSLYTGIICHFINNCYAVISITLLGSQEIFSADMLPGGQTTFVILGIFSVLAAVICIYFIFKRRYVNPEVPEAINTETIV